jgi:NTE family protein
MKGPKLVNLALQGGGALGAFTWGVLDRLLEDEHIEIGDITGASAGAMNAVVLCAGLAERGKEGAREALAKFWHGVARAGENNPFRQSMLYRLLTADMGPIQEALTTPWRLWAKAVAGMTSPYDFNPLNLNPIEDLLEELVDFPRVRACTTTKIFLAATNVETGRVRIFTNPELTPKHVTASACLPQIFQAVEIGGAFYWDGGYMGNPPLFPLFAAPRSRDIIIVQLNPIERKGEPRTVDDINARINEITFNASLLRELRAIEFVSRLLDEGRLDAKRYNKMLLHVINDDADLAPLGVRSKLKTDIEFFEDLFAFGRNTADKWLNQNMRHIGVRATVDLKAMFDGEVGPPGIPPAEHSAG